MESKLYIVDNVSLARTSEGDELVVNVLCYQEDPNRKFMYGLKYDYGRILPVDVFCRRLPDSDHKVRLVRGVSSAVLSVGGVQYTVEPGSELEQVAIEASEDAVHEFWRDRQLVRLASENVSIGRRFAYAARRFLDL